MRYYPAIDGLRFIAIFLVLMAHFAPFIAKLIVAGWIGVDLFFIISGFLITTILLNPSFPFLKSYRNFIIKRTLRIFPIYYLLTFLLLALNVEVVKDSIVYILTYTYNFQVIKHPFQGNMVEHFWSLSVEEQFYLFWPFIVLPLKNNRKALIIIISMIILVSYLQFSFDIFPTLSEYNFYGTFPRMGSLGLGALSALLDGNIVSKNRYLSSKTTEVAVLILISVAGILNYFTLLSFCSFFIVLKAVYSSFKIKVVRELLNNKMVIKIGQLSYGIYLFHLPISYLLDVYFNPIWSSLNWQSISVFKILRWHAYLVKFPLYSLISITTAYLSYMFIEKPILNLKRYFR